MIYIGKGVKHFKKESGLKWSEINERLKYGNIQSARNLVNKKQGCTTLVDRLAAAFNVSASEFIKQCEGG